MSTWKWFYYAPNTYKELKVARLRRDGKKLPAGANPEDAITLRSFLEGACPYYSFAELMGVVLLPYLVLHFFVAPLPYLLVGEQSLLTQFGYTGAGMYSNAVKNLFLAEILTNLHSFLAIATNHSGDDMYRFRDACRPFSGSFYLRQVLASVDYQMGTNLIDFMHGWLNYQIEHHMWPNLSMLSYQKSAAQVEEICTRYGVPYVKHSVFWRLKKTVDVMVGSANMRWFPENYEKLYLEKDALAEAVKGK
jgi:fatty acid desaturase